MSDNKSAAINPNARRTEKVPGCSVSVYIQPRNMKHYRGIKRMASQCDKSFSEIFNDTLRQVYFGQRTGVTISADAYMAIANGDLDALITIPRTDGGVELALNQKAVSPDSMDCPDRTFPDFSSKATAYSIGVACLYDAVEPSEMIVTSREAGKTSDAGGASDVEAQLEPEAGF